MGTRADFYLGRGPDAEWIGSTAFDGYPEGISPDRADWPEGGHLFDAKTAQEYRDRLERYFQDRDDVTRPALGWPWPWDDSRTTDYAYAFDDGVVYASCSGHDWFVATDPPEDECEGTKVAVFPDMSKRKSTTFGKRSGLLLLGGDDS